MENKDVIVDKLLCMACLCVDRALHKVTDQKMQRYYMETLNEIPLCNVPQVCPSLCWECTAMLKKAASFKEQVKDSYRILQAYTSENFYECLLTDITRTPHLKVHHIEPVSIPPSADEKPSQEIVEVEVPRLNDRPRVEVQLVYVKEENDDWLKDLDDTQLCDNEIHDRSPSVCSENINNIETDINKIRKKERKKSKTKIKEKAKIKRANKMVKKNKTDKLKHIKPEEGEGQKILTIELSYEDMLLEREKESTRASYVSAEYKCESCLIGFNYSKSYVTHMASKHSPELGEYSCPICKTVMKTVESFTSHYKRHMRRYECGICHKRTLDIKVMQQHYYTTHQISLKQYQCTLCGNISKSIEKHRYHRDTHKSRVQCTECEKTFSHRAGLLTHRRAFHERRNTLLCTHCGRRFRWQTSLNRHALKHHSKDKQSSPAAFCTACDIGFASVSSYQRHLRNSLKHVTEHQLRFICDDCGRRFADKTKLRDHIEEKHLHKTYQCHICQKPSKSRVGLDQHIRNVHTGRPHNKICHHCGKGFPTKVQLESHIRTHTGERPFICEYCPTTFSQQSNLYKHNRQVHLNIKSKRYPITKKRKDARPESTNESDQFTKPALHLTNDRSFVT